MWTAETEAKTRRAIEETCATVHKHYVWTVTERAHGRAVLAVANDDPPVRVEAPIDVRRVFREWRRNCDEEAGRPRFSYLTSIVDDLMNQLYEACDKANTCAHEKTFRARDGRRCADCRRRMSGAHA